MKCSLSSTLLALIICAVLPEMISAFWVAPMWGNKVEGEAYGPQAPGGSSTISAHRGPSGLNPDGGMPGMAMSGYGKYPGWVSRKQGEFRTATLLIT